MIIAHSKHSQTIYQFHIIIILWHLIGGVWLLERKKSAGPFGKWVFDFNRINEGPVCDLLAHLIPEWDKLCVSQFPSPQLILPLLVCGLAPGRAGGSRGGWWDGFGWRGIYCLWVWCIEVGNQFPTQLPNRFVKEDIRKEERDLPLQQYRRMQISIECLDRGDK